MTAAVMGHGASVAAPALQLHWPLAPDVALDAHDLGALVFGAAAPAGKPAADAPILQVMTPALAPARPWLAAWRSPAPVRAGRHGRVSYRCAGGLLFGVVTVAEDEWDEAATLAGATQARLQCAAGLAYAELFGALDALAHPHLLRVWNYLPHINAEEGGEERYRQFNAGRQAAFAAHGRTFAGEVPAACALGVGGGPLAIAFLAATQPALAVENPRQVAAYDYPPEYGRRSPTFARATLARHGGQRLLFVSGTASIVGHRSLHAGDVVAQTRETLANIDALLAEAARLAPEAGFRAEALAYVAYLRRPQDLPLVRAEVERRLGVDAAIAYVQADVCRADLLVEIEASGGHPMEFRCR